MRSDLGFDPVGTDRRYAFSPSVAAADGTVHRAWLETGDDDATGAGRADWDVRLRTTAGPVATGDTPRRPTLVAGPERVHLFWTAEVEGDWPLFHAPLTDLDARQRLTDGERPPLDVTGCPTDDGVAVAWSAAGDESEIRGLAYDGEWGPVETLSAGADAAYDAALAPAADADEADRYLLYTALRDGWYEVVGRRLVGGEWTDPQVLSDQPGLAAYPTVVGAGGADGPAAPAGPPGAWVAWAVHVPGERNDVRAYVGHQRREDQHAPFRGRRAVYVSHWDGDDVRVPVYDRDWAPVGEANDVSGLVPPAGEGTRPALLGGDALRLAWLDYENRQDRPRLGVSRFAGDRWTDARYGPVYGDAERLHHTLDGATPVLAAGRDTRPMGGWDEFEMEDHDGHCEVGQVRLPAASDGTQSVDLQRQGRWVHGRRDARNPAVEATSEDGRTLLFVNLHRHTDLSVCGREYDGEPDFNARLARDLVREDAFTVTDHCYNSDPLARFKADRAVRFYDAAGLVAVPSYEWTGTHRTVSGEHHGHFNVHWFEDGLPPLGVPNVGTGPAEPTALDAALDGHDALAVPHHTANRSHYLRPELFGLSNAPVVEVFQSHRGSCEERGGPGATELSDVSHDRSYVRSALDRGHRLGFVGGGDHCGVALTGVWVDDVSRSGVHDAIRERRCFATTGTTLALDARVGETRMGDTHHPPVGVESVTYAVDARVPDGVERVQVVRDGDVVHEFGGGGDRVDAAVTLDRNPATDHYVYARFLLSNGEVAWASPVWVAAD